MTKDTRRLSIDCRWSQLRKRQFCSILVAAPAVLLFGLTRFSSADTTEFNFRGPFGVAVNSHNVVYVAEVNRRCISKFTADGKWLGVIDHVDGYGPFQGPFDVAIGPKDRIYITDCLNHKVLVLDEQEKLQFVLGSDAKGSEPGAFSEPHFLTVNKLGEIFVADTFNARIQKFSPQGKFIAAWGKVGTGPGDILHHGYLARLDVDGHGFLYVREFDGGRIQKYTEDGRYVATFSERGTERGQLDEGYGLSVINDRLYCADTFESRIQVFSLEGQLLDVWDPGEGNGGEHFNHPVDVAQTVEGDLIVTDWKNDRVVKTDSRGKFLATWGRSASDLLSYQPPQRHEPPQQRPLRFGIYGSCDDRTIDACKKCGVDIIYYSIGNQDGDWGIAEGVTRANSQGIEVHPSIAMQVFGQESMKFIDAHPELTIWKKGAVEPMKTILSWAQPEARRIRADHLVEQARVTGVQGIMLDYIRYLGTDYGYDPVAIDAFMRQYGINPNDLPQTDPRWMQFRADYITEFNTDLRHKLATRLDHHVELSVYLSGDDPTPGIYLTTSLQDWRTWARMGIVDKVHVAWYTRDFDAIYRAIRRVREAIPDRVVLNCFIACYGGNLNSPELLKKGYEVAFAAGADEVTLYRGDAIWEQDAWPTVGEIIAQHR